MISLFEKRSFLEQTNGVKEREREIEMEIHWRSKGKDQGAKFEIERD